MVKKMPMISRIICAVLILVGAVLWYTMARPFDPKEKAEPVPVGWDVRLADPDLLYASMSSFGLCANEKGEDGGCYTEYYLYKTGKFNQEIGWTGYDGRKTNSPYEKQLDVAVVAQIIKKIQDSGVMSADCPMQNIMDASWNYQINLDGVKKAWRNPPTICQNVFYAINDILVPLLEER